jgi:hypothetical protein
MFAAVILFFLIIQLSQRFSRESGEFLTYRESVNSGPHFGFGELTGARMAEARRLPVGRALAYVRNRQPRYRWRL